MLKTLQEIFDDPNLSASMEKKNKDLLINLLLREDIRKLVDQQSQGSELKSHELEQIKNNLEKISVDKGASPDAKQTAIAWLFDINLKKLDNNSLDPEKKLQIFTELKKLLDASELPENKQNAMKSLTAKSREILDNNTVDKEIQKTAASWLLNEGINLLKKEGIDLSEKQSIATDMIQILQHSNPKPATDITNQIREQAADLLIRANKAILKDPSFQDNRQFYANDIRYLLTNHSSLGIENLPQETKQMAIDLLLDKDLSGLNNFSNLQQNEKDQIMNGLLWITNNQNASVESKQKAVHLLMEIYGKILQEETTDQNNKSKILNALSSLSQNPNANQLDKEWVTELTKYYQNQMNPNYQSQYSQMTQNYQYPQNQGNPNFPANQYSQIQNPASQSQNQPNPNFQNSQNPNYSQNQYPSQNQGNPNQYFPSQNLPANQYSKTNQTQGNSNYQNQSQYSQMPQNPASQNQPNPASPNYQNPNYQNPANPNPANQFPSQPNPNFPNPNPSQGSPNPQNQGNPNQ
jgi:hypothetical protein